jgi:O-antigen ligase
VDTANSGRISVTEEANTNGVAILLFLGVYALMVEFINRNIITKVLMAGCILAVSYAMILTGSRKSFISLGIILVFWVIFCYIPEIFRKKSIFAILGVIALTAVVCGTVVFFWGDISEMTLFQRLFGLSEEIEGGKRVTMYEEAVALFLRSPLFGVGYKNFEVNSRYGVYSHSTYAESLSCTGLIGSVFYFGTFGIIFANAVKAYLICKKNKDWQNLIRIKLSIFFLAAIAFLSVGMILFYSFTGSAVLIMLISENNKILNHYATVRSASGSPAAMPDA